MEIRGREVNMMDEVEHPNRTPTTFVELSQAAHCSNKTRRPSDSISERFCSIAVFNSSNWEQYFSEFIVSLFGKSS